MPRRYSKAVNRRLALSLGGLLAAWPAAGAVVAPECAPPALPAVAAPLAAAPLAPSALAALPVLAAPAAAPEPARGPSAAGPAPAARAPRAAPAAGAAREAAPEEIAMAGHRLWDNWGYYDADAGLYRRFALAAPKSAPLRRLDHASHVRAFSSPDGRRWTDRGAFLRPGFAPQAGAVWSGSAWRDPKTGGWAMYFTARRRGRDAVQSLWSAPVRRDGSAGQPRLLMDAGDPAFRARAEALGYHLGEGDGVVSALRDPFRDGDDLYFAAKGVFGGRILPAVGRARWNGTRWVLRRPLRAPLGPGWTQIELPQVVRAGGRRLLMVSVTDGGRTTGVKTRRSGVLFFRLRGARVEPLPRGDRLSGLILPRARGLYTLNQLRGAPDGAPFLLSFRAPGSRRPYTLPPPLSLDDVR
jgi:hypothetical protein